MDLEQLFETEEEDQVYLERILEYIDDTIAEDDMFMETLVVKFEGLTLYWELPWYQQSRILIKKFQEVQDGDMYRTDKICQDEKDHIHKRWKKLVKKYGIPDKPICLARWTNKRNAKNKKYGFDPKCEQSAKLFAIAFLARGLRRTLQQVHFYFVNKHIQLERKTPYSRNEHRVIEIFMKQRPDGMPLALISKVLHRTRRNIYTRCDIYKNGIETFDIRKKYKRWNEERASNFLKALLEETGLQLNELKDRFFNEKVWRVMHEQFVGAKRFWYDKLHVQLFVKREVKLNRFRRKIFKTLKSCSYRVWLDINWEHLAKRLTSYDGITKRFTYKVAHRLFRKNEKMLYVKPLQELIEYALDKTKSPTYRQKNRRLKRMTLTEEGNLIWATATADLHNNKRG